MTTTSLITLFKRDLNALKTEINAYTNEDLLWETPKGISNAAGNLCLHLVGNLNHFIGAALGNTGYVRQRDLEFSQKDVPRTQLITQVEQTIPMIESVLASLTEAELQETYKHRVFDKPMTTEYFLIHLAMHLAYHLGQINYHRRLLDT